MQLLPLPNNIPLFTYVSSSFIVFSRLKDQPSVFLSFLMTSLLFASWLLAALDTRDDSDEPVLVKRRPASGSAVGTNEAGHRYLSVPTQAGAWQRSTRA